MSRPDQLPNRLLRLLPSRPDLQPAGRPSLWPVGSWMPPGRRRRQPRTLGLLAAVLLGLLLSPPLSRAVPAGGITVPLPSRVDRYNPDELVCKPETIRSSFNRQLQPWADQPPQVLAQLRRVQLEMTRATLQRCVRKGLMDAAAAQALEHQLGLSAPGAPATAGPTAPVPK